MARTPAGEVLTSEHRRAQLQVRAAALRDFQRLWPLWQGDQESFGRFVDATLPLVTAYHRASSGLALSYYDAYRRAERVTGDARPVPAPALDLAKVVAGLVVTGRITVGRAILAGQSPQAAMQTALTSVSGSVVRNVMAGGRDVVVLSSGEDPQARGWMRVTDGQPCAFCAMLATRGAAYKGQDTAEFQAHDHCGCTAEPAYDGTELPPASRRFSDLYDRAQRDAARDGGSSGTSNDALNNFRRLLASR